MGLRETWLEGGAMKEQEGRGGKEGEQRKTFPCRSAPPVHSRHPMRVLLTTTSYQDTPGDHHALLESQGFDIHRERGPLPESRMLELAGDFDAFLCGDDEITKAVLDKALPRLKVISLAFGMEVHGMDLYWPEAFAKDHPVTRHETIESLIAQVDVLSLHANLSESTKHLVRAGRIALAKKGLLVINTSRAELVHMPDMIAALDAGTVGGYATDVLDEEPPPADHPLLKHPKALITPHIGSRTYESVPRQAMRATLNLVNYLSGAADVIQANKF